MYAECQKFLDTVAEEQTIPAYNYAVAMLEAQVGQYKEAKANGTSIRLFNPSNPNLVEEAWGLEVQLFPDRRIRRSRLYRQPSGIVLKLQLSETSL